MERSIRNSRIPSDEILTDALSRRHVTTSLRLSAQLESLCGGILFSQPYILVGSSFALVVCRHGPTLLHLILEE